MYWIRKMLRDPLSIPNTEQNSWTIFGSGNRMDPSTWFYNKKRVSVGESERPNKLYNTKRIFVGKPGRTRYTKFEAAHKVFAILLDIYLSIELKLWYKHI